MAMACSIEGCAGQVKSRGYCRAHYSRWYKFGDPSLGGPLRTPNGAKEKFIRQHVAYAGDDCLIWPFSRDEYGRAKMDLAGRKTPASRFMCQLANGPPPEPTFHAAHSCGNGHLGCVNPRHLRWATPLENVRDQILHGTMARGQRSGPAKLSDADALEILALKGSGLRQREVAERYGVSHSAIQNLWSGRRRSWMGEAK